MQSIAPSCHGGKLAGECLGRVSGETGGGHGGGEGHLMMIIMIIMIVMMIMIMMVIADRRGEGEQTEVVLHVAGVVQGVVQDGAHTHPL